jgi:hypothetical protein
MHNPLDLQENNPKGELLHDPSWSYGGQKTTNPSKLEIKEGEDSKTKDN